MSDTKPSRLTDFRESVLRLLNRCEVLLPKVESCVNQVGRINTLVTERDKLPHAKLEGDDVDRRYKKLDAEIEELYSPFRTVTNEVRIFFSRLDEIMQTVPVTPQELLRIRDEILRIALRKSTLGRMAMDRASRDLSSVRLRLRDLLDLLEPTDGDSRKATAGKTSELQMAAGSDGQSDEPANAESLLAGNDEVTKGTAQKYLGVSDRQIRKLIKAGKLTTVGEGQHQKVTVKSLRRRKGTKAPRKKEIRNPSEPKGTKRNS